MFYIIPSSFPNSCLVSQELPIPILCGVSALTFVLFVPKYICVCVILKVVHSKPCVCVCVCETLLSNLSVCLCVFFLLSSLCVLPVKMYTNRVAIGDDFIALQPLSRAKSQLGKIR